MSGWAVFFSPIYVTYNQLIFMFFRRVRQFLPNAAISRGHHPNRHSHDSKHRFLIHSGQTSTKISTTYQMMNEILHPVVGTDGWNPRPFRCSSAGPSPGLSEVPTRGVQLPWQTPPSQQHSGERSALPNRSSAIDIW